MLFRAVSYAIEAEAVLVAGLRQFHTCLKKTHWCSMNNQQVVAS